MYFKFKCDPLYVEVIEAKYRDNTTWNRWDKEAKRSHNVRVFELKLGINPQIVADFISE